MPKFNPFGKSMSTINKKCVFLQLELKQKSILETNSYIKVESVI